MPPRSLNPRSLSGVRILQRSGENELTKQYPQLSGFLESFLMGTAPDELGSVMDPLTAERRKGAEYGYPIGIGAQVAPIIGGLGRFAKAVAAAPSVVPGSRAAQRGVIKMKGGNWLSGSVEGALKELKRPQQLDTLEAQRRAGIQLDENDIANTAALNNWIDKQLTRYVQKDMATPGDPIRALAERGVLHVNPEDLNFRAELHGKYMEPGQTAVAQSPAAKSWEGASDLKVHTTTPRQILGNDAWLPAELDTRIASNPWLTTVPPETPVHGIAEPRQLSEDLGFKHLIDELRNATNPASGLPRELLLKYESLPQVSVPQAVERVAAINAWRAAQKAEADAAKANNAATVLHKDYPDKGFKWVELKGRNPDEFEQSISGLEPKAWDEAIKKFRTERETELGDALKYEGDTMGHCVGGYCPDVLEGRSRIFSLRSAKGEPHVTVEVGQPRNLDEQHIPDRYLDEALDMLGDDMGMDPDQVHDLARELYSMENPSLQRIIQIKGKANRAPNPEYLPFVQDFVKSGKWSDIGDFHNTGLDRARERFNANALKTLEEQGRAVPEFATPAEIEDLRNFYSTLPPEVRLGADLDKGIGDWTPEGYAAGGLVNQADSGYNPARVAELTQQLRAELFPQ